VNRARFLLDIITAVRGVVGKDYPVWCRIDGQEFATDDGITLEEAKETARLAETVGIDAVHVSGYGGSQGVHFTDAPLVNVPGLLIPLAHEIKNTVKIPVITAGRISLERAEAAIQAGEADFVAMGRPLLADPDLPNKISRGSESEVRRCIYCYSCVHQIFVRNNVCCTVNPSVGKEGEPIPPPPERKKKVVVVGAGPAGMEAAIEAASRGHRVTLYEKDRELGGTLLLASIMRPENIDLIKNLIGRLDRSEITVKLEEAAKPDIIAQEHPDVLILATGAAHQNPSIPGIDGKNVIDGNDLRYMLHGQHDEKARARVANKLTVFQKAVLYPGRTLMRPFLTPLALRRLTRFWMPLGKRIVILGAGLVGCEMALFLTERGRRVTILESSDQIAPEMSLPMKWIVLDKLERLQVSILTEVKYDFINPAGIEVILHNGNHQFVPADKVIIAYGTMSDKDTIDAFQGKAAEIYTAGDCGKVSYIKDSIAEGYRLGSSI
jgi:2,4-dienoyl-CoA reductase (NADPH2)